MSAQSVEILERLVGFPTISDQSNLDLISFVQDFLAARGIETTLVPDKQNFKANLFATVGPKVNGGIILSGHTDVVPTKGQTWSSDPFRLTPRDGRFFGRGTADMKGFVACALRAADIAARQELKRPLHIALSYDEEVGCLGVRSLIDTLMDMPTRPALCVVGEPTGMRLALGHKGKIAAQAVCRGVEGHSAMAPHALNAIHIAADFVYALRARQIELQEHGARDDAYDVPYTTIHAGKINGGVALNIVPNSCTVDFEIRNVPTEDPAALFDLIQADAADIVAKLRPQHHQAEIRIAIGNSYPGLEAALDEKTLEFVRSLTGDLPAIKVSFGTEGGLYQQRLKIPTIVCGPGSMEQGHKPDEFVSREQIARCDAMLDDLVASLAA